MAMGFLGSNGGIQEVYLEKVIRCEFLETLDAVISRYDRLLQGIPEEQTKVRNFYRETIEELTELRQKMSKGLESSV